LALQCERSAIVDTKTLPQVRHSGEMGMTVIVMGGKEGSYAGIESFILTADF